MAVDISLAVMDLLTNNAQISPLVDSVSFDRIPQVNNAGNVQLLFEKGIVLWAITETPHNDLLGSVGIDQPLFRIDSYAKNRADANKIAWTVWTELDAFQGVVQQIHIKGVHRQTGIRYNSDRALLGTDRYRVIATQDILFTYHSLELVS